VSESVLNDFGKDDDIPPIGRAILSTSLEALDACIEEYPESLYEKIGGYNSLQLCVGWPQGLERLLQTTPGQAICEDWHLDDSESPLCLAIFFGYVDSADLLTRSGSPMGTRDWIKRYFPTPSSEHSVPTFELVIDRIVSRRKELLSTAQNYLGIFLDYSESYVVDGDAAFIFQALSQAGIAGISHLYVDPTYETIFLSDAFDPNDWPILYDRGFREH
jgi:hypothetical protein